MEKNQPTKMTNFRLTETERARIDLNAEAHQKHHPLVKDRTAFMRLFLLSLPDNAADADALAQSGAIHPFTRRKSRARVPA